MIPVKPPPLLPDLAAPAHGHGLTQDDFRVLSQYLAPE